MAKEVRVVVTDPKHLIGHVAVVQNADIVFCEIDFHKKRIHHVYSEQQESTHLSIYVRNAVVRFDQLPFRDYFTSCQVGKYTLHITMVRRRTIGAGKSMKYWDKVSD